MKSRRGALVVGLCALTAFACVSFPEPRTLLVDSVGPPLAPRHVRPPDVWRERALVPVRIARAEQRHLLFVDEDGRRRRISRADALVSLDGGPLREFITIGVAGARSEVEFEGRRYRGALVAYAHPASGLRLENWVGVEDYVEGVVASEVVLWDAPPALLEIQAIAARSFATATLDRRARADRAFLWDGVEDQAYRGVFVPDTASKSRRLDTLLANAVEATRGRVLLEGRHTFDARFHAACGGHTAMGPLVFGPGAPAVATTTCTSCAQVAPWRRRLLPEDLTAAAKQLGLEQLGRPVPTRNDAAGRWLEVELRSARGVHPVAAGELRRAIGWERLPSTWILDWKPLADGGAEVTGRGRGHGVGLCQEGARALAARGFDSRSILAHYYPGIVVGPMPTPLLASAR